MEMFMLSRSAPKVNDYFNFEKHHNGPYSLDLHETVMNPFVYDNPYQVAPSGIILTENGKKIFNDLGKKFYGKKFLDLIKIVKLIRKIYDPLLKNELLFLTYKTYPKYIDASNICDKLNLDTKNSTMLADSLLKKGVITQERYEELLK